MFARHGVELPDQTLCDWMAQCAQLLEPLYGRLKRHVLSSKVVGTDDTPVKVLDRKLPQAPKAASGRMSVIAIIPRWFTITRRHANVRVRKSF